MSFSSRLLRIPKPRKFLYAFSLSTGASLITLSLLINKLSGLYGILALLTGFHLSPVQLSMYIYSILALGLTVYLTPFIKSESPLYCVGLAWFYVLDSIVNAVYTALFAVTWFLVLLGHQNGDATQDLKGPGAGMVGDTAGFTDPIMNVSGVEVVGSPQSGAGTVANSTPANVPAGTGQDGFVWGRESINSVGIIVALWTVRIYFCLVMLAWARMVLRQHIASMHSKNPNTDFGAASENVTMAENPFEDGKPDGQGWKGKLGRTMIAIGKGYWLGTDGDNSWMNGMGGKFGQQSQHQTIRRQGALGSVGTNPLQPPVPLGKINSERESRRRSGTGPPLPSVAAAAGVISDGEDGPENTNFLQVPASKV